HGQAIHDGHVHPALQAPERTGHVQRLFHGPVGLPPFLFMPGDAVAHVGIEGLGGGHESPAVVGRRQGQGVPALAASSSPRQQNHPRHVAYLSITRREASKSSSEKISAVNTRVTLPSASSRRTRS